MNMKKSVFLFIGLFLSLIVNSQELLPTSTTGQIINHTYYSLSCSEPNEQAEWVYYNLTPSLFNGSASRPSKRNS